MPSISKQFHLEITVDQFLRSCSLIELQEVDLLVGSYIKRAAEMRQDPPVHHPSLEEGLQEISSALNQSNDAKE